MNIEEAAVDLCQKARDDGQAVFVVYLGDDGILHTIGPRMPGSKVAKWLRAAADEFEKAMRLRSVN